MKKIIFMILLFLLVFVMYKIFYNEKLTYISLGDSLAKGINSYGITDYGYSDYLKDYLDKNDKLNYYTKDYATEGYRIIDVLNDIRLNKKIKIKNYKEGLKTILRRSDLLTLSVGANDILYKINNDLDDTSTYELNNYINGMLEDYDELLKEINKYFKGELIIVGYYNPYINKSSTNARKIENSFLYMNEQMKKLAKNYNRKYINIYEIFRENNEYLPNPNNIHPSKEGYRQISKMIIEKLENNNINI